MTRQEKIKPLLSAFFNFMFFFALAAFVATCCTMLFVSVMSVTLDITLTDENIGLAAKMTFVNVLIISVLFTVVDYLRRKVMVDRPTRLITNAAKRIMEGDFTTKIDNVNSYFVSENLNEIIDCFNRMAEELSGVETLRSDFISNVSHEMKTPLAAIQNYSKLLLSADLSDAERREYAESIAARSKRLSDMVSNVLRLTKLENQQIYPQSKRYNLSEQICECLLAYEDVWEEKGLDIVTDIEEDVYIEADAELLSLVWNNLLSNAFKFTDKGSVSVSLSYSDGCATVSVQDTGCGMNSDVGAHIFEKFYQADNSRATDGNGLGLALVKRVVDIMRGEIGVESVVSEGTKFVVRLWGCDDGKA